MLKDRQHFALSVAEALRMVRLGEESAISALQNLLIDSLSETQREAYDWVLVSGDVDSRFLADEWTIYQSYASTLLNNLWQFGLLARREYVDRDGKRFIYSVRDAQPSGERGRGQGEA